MRAVQLVGPFPHAYGTPVHEAGHLTLMSLAGIRHGGASVEPDHRSKGRVNAVADPKGPTLPEFLTTVDVPPIRRAFAEPWVVVYLAGAAAESVACRGDEPWPRRTDLEALEVGKLIYDDVEAMMPMMWNHTRRLLRVPIVWRLVDVLAEALRWQDVVTAEEVQQLAHQQLGALCGETWIGLDPNPYPEPYKRHTVATLENRL